MKKIPLVACLHTTQNWRLLITTIMFSTAKTEHYIDMSSVGLVSVARWIYKTESMSPLFYCILSWGYYISILLIWFVFVLTKFVASLESWWCISLYYLWLSYVWRVVQMNSFCACNFHDDEVLLLWFYLSYLYLLVNVFKRINPMLIVIF